MIGLKNPFNLDVFLKDMYYINENSLFQMDKFGRGINMTAESGLILPHSVKIYHKQKYPDGKINIFTNRWFEKCL